MDWELVKYFLAVADKGSASAAARELDVNHATVLRKLEQLEQALDLKLFSRLQSGYRLTNQGQALLQQAQSMNRSATALLREARGLQTQPEGNLVLSTPDSSLIDLSLAIGQFIRQYPQIQLDIKTSTENTNLNLLEADIALRLTNSPPENLVGKQVSTVTFYACCARSYLDNFKQTPTPEDCHWLLWSGARSSSLPEAHHPDRLLSDHVGENQVLLRCNSVTEILGYTKQGLGVSLLEEHIVKKHQLIKLPFDLMLKQYRLDKAGLWLLSHKDLVHTERVSVFRQFMIDELPKVLNK